MMFRKICGRCGKEYVSERRSELALLERCEECLASLPRNAVEFDPEDEDVSEEQNTPKSAQETQRANSKNRENQDLSSSALAETNSADVDELELKMDRANCVVPLPSDNVLIGRIPGYCSSIREYPTISKRQFSYQYSGDGCIEIMNLSQFGTIVDGRLLEEGESAVAGAGSLIEMGGLAFTLRKRSQ